ncbi:MAG: NADH-quinone oxidoreductase subunit L [Pseudomonadota bacterium]
MDAAIQTPYLMAAAAAAVAPFAGFLVIMVLARKRPGVAAALSIGAVSVSFVCALGLLVHFRHLARPLIFTASWMSSGSFTVPIGVLIDPLSLLMLTIVSTVSLLVQIYSLGYMAGDPGFGRYYGFMSLFSWAMISLTLSPTLLQLYVFWELVGVASYLLIGFWFEKFSASTAGKKAFVMTRLGDVAFLLGLLVLLVPLGHLDIVSLNGAAPAGLSPGTITLAVLLIFGGIAGKSAQFPLMTWLPDAMEGPTPVSALLHSATMVAAGVFLFARLFPFFSRSPAAMTLMLAVGTLSMLLAATMAMVARDIKQVWAFSTISQLGFMIMGLAAGGYAAGVFHLTTHAAFKALLFLCAGVFIHAFGTNDMFDIGRRGGRRMRVPMISMVVGAGALSGLPPLSGFFSKEAIMGALAGKGSTFWLAAGLLGAFLTAYYTFRLIFIMGFPRTAAPPADTPDADHGHHGARDWVMEMPLIVLTAVTLLLGAAHEWLSGFLSFGAEGHPAAAGHFLPAVAVACAVGGLALAWFEFGRSGAAQVGFVERMPVVKKLFAERWYIDRCYRWLLDHLIINGISRLFAAGDNHVIDGGVDGVGAAARAGGRFLSALHGGMIQYKLMAAAAAVILLSFYFFL